MRLPTRLPILGQSEAEVLAALGLGAAVPIIDPTPSKTAGNGPLDDEGDAEVVLLLPRPTSRSQCKDGVRPCPWVSCRYNLYLDVRADGIIKYNFPGREPEEMTASCSLDLASDGPRTLDQVALLMGMSRERARQIEEEAMIQIRRDFEPEDLLGED